MMLIILHHPLFSFFASLGVKRAFHQKKARSTTPSKPVSEELNDTVVPPDWTDYSVLQRSTFILVTAVSLEVIYSHLYPRIVLLPRPSVNLYPPILSYLILCI